GCCKTKYLSFKVKDNHIATDGITTSIKHFTDLHLFAPLFETMAWVKKPKGIANPGHAPPLDNTAPIYILNCVFRI
ncbi:MAG TPA: hypothetical protein VKB95_06165, partial [Chitinophagaceae bacterium]|nr:hypothetical protein [Chitinophagaceae bacterium]